MQVLGVDAQFNPSWPLFAGGGVALYIAARSAADALVGGQSARAGRLAIANWMPIVVVALAAALLNQPTVAIGVIFATSVASLTLGIGTISLLAPFASPPSPADPPLSASWNSWPMILPTALLVFLAGFRGELTMLHAAVLAAEGIVVLIIWNDRRSSVVVVTPSPSRFRWLRAMQFILSVALAGIGAWSAIHGMEQASHSSEAASPALLAATFLSPLLLLPLLGTGVDLVHRGFAEAAASACVGLMLLNVCALIPILIVFSHAAGRLKFLTPTGPLQLPLVVWRVDVVALIVLGLFLLPVGLGRWKLSRMQGLGLIGGYVAYLALSVLLGMTPV
jgi:Ca2+/Na+ antiporter